MLVISVAPSGIFAVGAFSPERMIQSIVLDVLGGSDQASTFVLDGQGQLLSQTGKSRLGPDLSRHPGAVGALRGESGTNYLATEQEELVIAFSPVALTNWALVILLGLHERAELIGGHLKVQSEPGAGTHLIIDLVGEA